MIIKQISVFEKETGRKCRRIYGGMQWPGANPGAVVVVAEDLEKDAALDERKFWILAEYENRNLSEIMTRCKDLEGLGVEKFYSDTTNLPMMSLMRSSEAKISLSKAPWVDEPAAHVTYLSLIREKTSATKKVLTFEKKAHCRQYYHH